MDAIARGACEGRLDVIERGKGRSYFGFVEYHFAFGLLDLFTGPYNILEGLQDRD
jgi:hypothetical protein